MATWIKVCGITSVEDAQAVAEAGADAIGVVFAPSPRRVSRASAREIAQAIHGAAQIVGVFVDADVDELRRMRDEVPLDACQLHGDEPLDLCAALRGRILKRIRVAPGDDAAALADRAAPFLAPGARAEVTLLLDPGAGSGRVFDWGVAAALPAALRARLVVSGGLTPENVAEAVREIRPAGVDVSSGVERAPGRKEISRVRAFVRAVRSADDGLA